MPSGGDLAAEATKKYEISSGEEEESKVNHEMQWKIKKHQDKLLSFCAFESFYDLCHYIEYFLE